MVLTSCSASRIALTETTKSIEKFCGSAWEYTDSILVGNPGFRLGEEQLYLEFESGYIDRSQNKLHATGTLCDRLTEEPLFGQIIIGELDSLENNYIIKNFKRVKTDSNSHFQLNEIITPKSIIIGRAIGSTVTMYFVNRYLR